MAKKKSTVLKNQKKDAETGYKLDEKAKKNNMAIPKYRKPGKGREEMVEMSKNERKEKVKGKMKKKKGDCPTCG